MSKKSKNHGALLTVVAGAIIVSSAIILVALRQNRPIESLVLQPPSPTPTEPSSPSPTDTAATTPSPEVAVIPPTPTSALLL